MKHVLLPLAKSIAEQLKPIYEHAQEREQVAWWLLQAITGFDDANLITQKEIDLADTQEKQLHEWLDKHINHHMPLQYILGWVPFGSLKILVKPPILIPRPETEEWSFALANDLQQLSNQTIKILDLCTGTGCVALALSQALPEAFVIGTDIADEALELAQKNAQENQIKNVSFAKSDIFNGIITSSQFDLIVSNPPYISNVEWEYLDPLVKNWEDRTALVADDNGLAIIKQIVAHAPQFLIKNLEMRQKNMPQLVIEIGYSQSSEVKHYMEQHGFVNVVIEKDLEGKDRVITGQLP